jgi:hypothetical protein
MGTLHCHIHSSEALFARLCLAPGQFPLAVISPWQAQGKVLPPLIVAPSSLSQLKALPCDICRWYNFYKYPLPLAILQ